MAKINKTSIRDEVGRIKADFEKLCSDGKIQGEIKLIMNSMFMEFMLSIFMEKTTRKDNKNSSIPSSQTDKDESSLPPKKGSNGNGKGKKKQHILPLTHVRLRR